MNTREIKFRVWDGWIMWYPETKTVDNKTTNIVFFNRENSIGWGLYEDDFDRRIVSGEHHKIMQYTGLKDKNNKEIYEGDICFTESKEYAMNKQVIWNDRLACFEFDYPLGKSILQSKYIEVIGNIYETPHLIKNQTV